MVSNQLHIHPIQNAYVPHLLETLCSFLTPWFCSYSYLFCGDVIYGISCPWSLDCFSCGDVIYGIDIDCLTTRTIGDSALTIVGITNGSTLPFIIFCAFKFVFSCSFFTPKLEAPPSSTLFFLLRTLFGECAATFLCSLVLYAFPPWFF